MIGLVLNCYKPQKMFEKAVDYCPHALEYVSDCFMTQKTCEKAVDTYPSTLIPCL